MGSFGLPITNVRFIELLRRCNSLSVMIDGRQVARAVLRNETPFQALSLRRLWMFGLNTTADMIAFSLDLRCHASLEDLELSEAALDSGAAVGAVADACIALRVRRCCRAMPPAIPQLTRLIAGGALQTFVINNDGVEMFGAAHESTRLFVDAVRASAMTALWLMDSGELPWNVVQAARFIAHPH